MTFEEAKEELPTIECFLSMACGMCTGNEAYCPSYCEVLEKAQRMPFARIQLAYARHDGEYAKIVRYIKNARC